MPNSSETLPEMRRSYTSWVESLRNMDDEAWGELLHYYADDLRSDVEISLRKRGLPLELIDDIEQETWLTAIRQFRDFVWEDEEKFYHWLRVISFNHIRTYSRLQKGGVSVQDYASADDIVDGLERYFDRQVPVKAGVEDDLILREQLSALDQAMRVLKPREREILMRRFMGETPRQIALDYQVKPRSISVILLRAKEKIEASLLHLQSIQPKDDSDA